MIESYFVSITAASRLNQSSFEDVNNAPLKFEALIEKNQERISRLAARYASNRGFNDDTYQDYANEGCLRLTKARDRLEREATLELQEKLLTTIIFRAFKNYDRTYFHSRSTNIHFVNYASEAHLNEMHLPTIVAATDNSIATKGAAESLMNFASPKQKRILECMLKLFRTSNSPLTAEEMPMIEIANELGMTVNAVRLQLSKLRRKFKLDTRVKYLGDNKLLRDLGISNKNMFGNIASKLREAEKCLLNLILDGANDTTIAQRLAVPKREIITDRKHRLFRKIKGLVKTSNHS